jgi:hypothetical protein
VGDVTEAGSRRRSQPAPPHVVLEALTEPDRDRARPWLLLLDDERLPGIIEAREPDPVVRSSLRDHRLEARIRFQLPQDGYGTNLRRVLLVAETGARCLAPGHVRRRINELINANLRYTFGQ